MRIRIVGAGWYGLSIGLALINAGFDVEIHEAEGDVFCGASGNMPARLHLGFHYPRSKKTRMACQAHHELFTERYPEFVRSVPTNIYAIAETDSLLDYGTYHAIMDSEESVIDIPPEDFGLRNVEGALLTGERHVVLRKAADFFRDKLKYCVVFNSRVDELDDPKWDATIDTTYSAISNEGIDRYESCLTLILEGPTERAVTIFDGPFPSLYPWDEENHLSSLTSAKWTPMLRTKTWDEARAFLDGPNLMDAVSLHAKGMGEQMCYYFPRLRDEYRVVDHRVAIRAMPRSAADARLVTIERAGERVIRVRAGKMDAIFQAEKEVLGLLWQPKQYFWGKSLLPDVAAMQAGGA